MDIGHSASRLFFGAIALTYILVEGGRTTMVLAAWLKESLNKRVERAERQGYEQASNEFEEADRQRREGETLSQAVERIRKEKAQQK